MSLQGVDKIPAETIIQSIHSILLVFDEAARPVTWNTEAALALGIKYDETEPHLSEELTGAVKTCIEMGKPMRVDECVIEVSGRARTFGFSASPLLNEGEVVGALITARDITERLAVNKEIEELKNRASFEKVALQLSNEFRKPLTSIKGHAQYIELLFPEDDPSIHYAKMISREVDRMDSVLVGLRDLGRAHDPELKLTSPEISVDKACELIAPYVESKGIDFACEMERLPRIIHDPSMMATAFLNLLTNAVDAVDFGGKVLFRAYPGKEGSLVVEVLDNGPGIEKEVQNRVFDIFYTGDKSSGQGIGLAVCREIVTSHHGEISIADVEGWSTCFRIEVASQ